MPYVDPICLSQGLYQNIYVKLIGPINILMVGLLLIH